MRPLSGRLAVWDVDRTLTRQDTLLPFLHDVVGRRAWARLWPRVAADVVRVGGGRAQLKDELLRRCLAGRSEAAMEDLADGFAHRVLATGCRPDALARWVWHRGRGDELALASASPGIYVRPLGTLLGAHHVLATDLQVVGGRLTGRRSTPNCRGEAKARRVADLIAARLRAEVWVYGDSRSDRPSLALADVPTRVRALRRLVTPPAIDQAVDPAARAGHGSSSWAWE